MDAVFVILSTHFHLVVGDLWNPFIQWESLQLSNFLQELVWRKLYWYLTDVFWICAALVEWLHIPYKSDRFCHLSTISVISLKTSNDLSLSISWKVFVVSTCSRHGRFFVICCSGRSFWRRVGEFSQLVWTKCSTALPCGRWKDSFLVIFINSPIECFVVAHRGARLQARRGNWEHLHALG